jgi:molybdopterin synthase catalytic subunit
VVASDGSARDSRDRIELVHDPVRVEHLVEWATTPSAGALVAFLGVVRDHAEGRAGVTALVYEAYEEPAVAAMRETAAEARRRWPEVARIALVHRLGRLELSEASVAVVVSSPHRQDAFEAARWCIDTVKQSVPIWKEEHWADGSDWALGATPIRAIESVDRPA